MLVKTFQKACQSNTITLLEVSVQKAKLIEKLENSKNTKIEGAWEKCFEQNIVINGNRKFLCGIELKSINSNIRIVGGRRTAVSSSFTLQKRRLITQTLIHNLKTRLQLDDDLLAAMEPLRLISLLTSREDLELCRSTLVPDFPQNQFSSDYYEAAEILKNDPHLTTLESLQKIIKVRPNSLTSIKLALARVAAAKPHSADVERLIS